MGRNLTLCELCQEPTYNRRFCGAVCTNLYEIVNMYNLNKDEAVRLKAAADTIILEHRKNVKGY